jgi:hypothetical protein
MIDFFFIPERTAIVEKNSKASISPLASVSKHLKAVCIRSTIATRDILSSSFKSMQISSSSSARTPKPSAILLNTYANMLVNGRK